MVRTVGMERMVEPELKEMRDETGTPEGTATPEGTDRPD